jgi:hypothetical protein
MLWATLEARHTPHGCNQRAHCREQAISTTADPQPGPSATHGVQGVSAQVHELGASRDLHRNGFSMCQFFALLPAAGGSVVLGVPAGRLYLVQVSAQLLSDDAAHVGQHLLLVLWAAAGRGQHRRGGGRDCCTLQPAAAAYHGGAGC